MPAQRLCPVLILGLALLAFSTAAWAQPPHPAARQALRARMDEVQKSIEELEDKMYDLAGKHGALVTSRERLWAELDRIESELRLAETENIRSTAQAEDLKKRVDALKKEAEEQLKTDQQLLELQTKLTELKAKRRRLAISAIDGEEAKKKAATLSDEDLIAKSLENPKKSGAIDSIQAEIIDASIEIAQRREALSTGYKAGQVVDLEKRLIEMQTEKVVREEEEKTLKRRRDEGRALLEHVTTYERLKRRMEELVTLRRRLVDLDAQQEVETFRAMQNAPATTPPAKPQTVTAITPR